MAAQGINPLPAAQMARPLQLIAWSCPAALALTAAVPHLTDKQSGMGSVEGQGLLLGRSCAIVVAPSHSPASICYPQGVWPQHTSL